MASGWSHAKVNTLAALGLLAAAHSYGWSQAELVALGVGCLVSTLFLSPDVDLKQSISSRSWGILRVLWIPYHRVFRHRRLSHWPVIGTLSRLLYLIVVLELLSHSGWAVYSLTQNYDPILAVQVSTEQVYRHKQGLLLYFQQHSRLLLVFFYGLVLGDCFHTLLDYLSSLWKRLTQSVTRPS